MLVNITNVNFCRAMWCISVGLYI